MPTRATMLAATWSAVTCIVALGIAACGENGGGGDTTADARVVGTTPEECVPPTRAERPTIAEPVVANVDSVYTIDLVQWGIANDGTQPVENRERINDALVWALENSYGTVILPAGTYLVGEPTTDNYASGIAIPGSMVLELDPGATLEMASNDRWNYCVIEVFGQNDVILRGGTVRGDRDTHVFEGGGAHDEGHTVCVWNESERVLIDSMRLTGGTGDGVLIVGGGGDGTSCKDITIRDNEIHDHRRQGVSIVGGVRVLIEGNEIHHIRGTSPQFGVDIESLAYESRDILIRDNHFHENQGGDYVNTDGTNVWFENNVCDQTGLTEIQTDGPIVHWQKTDQTIRGNTVTITVGSTNGRWGIIGYAPHDQARTNPAANYIEDNVFHDGGMHLAWTNLMHVTGNTVNDFLILGYQSTCMLLQDNAINHDGGENYKIKEVSGEARGNLLNGEPFDMPMSYDTSFTNSPPHMW